MSKLRLFTRNVVDDLGQPVDVHAPVENVEEALEALGSGVLLWVWVNRVLDGTVTLNFENLEETREPSLTSTSNHNHMDLDKSVC